MIDPRWCSKCGADFRGEEIPAEYREWYGDTTHFSRLIGISIRGAYDGVLVWKCPDCGHMWPRFTDGGRRHSSAMAWIIEQEARNALCAV